MRETPGASQASIHEIFGYIERNREEYVPSEQPIMKDDTPLIPNTPHPFHRYIYRGISCCHRWDMCGESLGFLALSGHQTFPEEYIR